MSVALFKNGDQKYTDLDLIDCLKQIGIQKGDILYMHSEMYNFGIPLIAPRQLFSNIINCIFETIGKEGTLIMPTFTYSFCKNEVYDKLYSKSTVGVLTEHFRKWGGGKTHK